MYFFQNDYNAMCAPRVLQHMNDAVNDHMNSYGKDLACERAGALIRQRCGRDDIAVHFLTGGTQVNLTVIAAALKPYQAVIAPNSGHINDHETGAIEATGHKIIAVEAVDGKLCAAQIETVVAEHYSANGPGSEHSAQPKLVYISVPSELGTMYQLSELEQISAVCKKHGLYLYADGARLGYGLSAADNDVSLADMARLCDVFYIGGTKLGAMFGEAVVITNPEVAADFRYMIKQRGGMLAKGWLLGLQFEALLAGDLYFDLAAKANRMADRLRATLAESGCVMPVLNRTNQVFAILPDRVLDVLSRDFQFTDWSRIDGQRRMVRFCTSWSTEETDVDALCEALRRLCK